MTTETGYNNVYSEVYSEYYNGKIQTQVLVPADICHVKYLTRHCCQASFDAGIMRCPFCFSLIKETGVCTCNL